SKMLSRSFWNDGKVCTTEVKPTMAPTELTGPKADFTPSEQHHRKPVLPFMCLKSNATESNHAIMVAAKILTPKKLKSTISTTKGRSAAIRFGLSAFSSSANTRSL